MCQGRCQCWDSRLERPFSHVGCQHSKGLVLGPGVAALNKTLVLGRDNEQMSRKKGQTVIGADVVQGGCVVL